MESLIRYIILFCILFITLIGIIVSTKVYGTWVNACNINNIVWSICCIGSSFGVFEYYIPKNITYLYILIYLISFFIASILAEELFTNKYKEAKSISFPEICIHISYFWIIFFVFVLIMMPQIITAIGYIVLGNIKILRSSYLLGPLSYMGKTKFYLYNYIIRPCFTSFSLLAVYLLFSNNKSRLSGCLLAICSAVTHVVLSGGRKEIFNLIIFLLLGYLVSGLKQKSVYIKEKKFIIRRLSKQYVIGIGIVAAGICFLFVITKNRLVFGQSVLQTIWQYFIGPLSYLDYIINHKSDFGLNRDNYLLGKATFSLISIPLDTVRAIVTGEDYRGVDYLLGKYSNLYYNISPTVKLNATETIIYPFIRDLGDCGLVIGSFFFAFLISFFRFMALTRKKKLCWNSIYIYGLFTVFFSFWRYQLAYVDGAMTCLFIVILFGLMYKKSDT